MRSIPSYSKEFPDLKDGDTDFPQDIYENPHYNRMLDNIRKNTCYVEMPDGKEQLANFISLAKNFSNTYFIDIEIFEGINKVSVNLFMLKHQFRGRFKETLSLLLNMCDEFLIIPHKSKKCDYIISLSASSYKAVYKND